jgi:hypothetical protein
MERNLGFQQSVLDNIKRGIKKELGQFLEYPGSKKNNEWYLTSWIEAKFIPSEQPKVEENTKK